MKKEINSAKGITLIALILFKLYYFIFKIKTLTPEEKAARDAARATATS